jgi:hypothetical protein
MGIGSFETILLLNGPIRMRVPYDSPLGLAILIPVLVLVGFVLLTVFFAVSRTFGGMRANAQLAATGMPAQGRVMAVQDLGGSIKMGGQVPQHRLQIDLEVYPQNGQPPYHARAVQMVSMLNFAQVQPGATVSVRYDPANPARVVVG